MNDDHLYQQWNPDMAEEQAWITDIQQYAPENAVAGGGALNTLLNGASQVLPIIDNLRNSPWGQWARQDQTEGFIPDSMIPDAPPRPRMLSGQKRPRLTQSSDNSSGGGNLPPTDGRGIDGQVPSGGPPLTGRGSLGCLCAKGTQFKYFDYSTGQSQLLGGAAPVTLSNFPDANAIWAVMKLTDLPQQGSDVSNRIGNVIRLKALKMNFDFFVVPFGANKRNLGPNYVRFMVFYDKQPNKLLPAYNDVLANTSGGTIAPITAHLNYNNKDRFTLLYDNTFMMCYLFTTDGSSVVTPISGTHCPGQLLKLTINLANRKMIFAGAGTDYTAVTTGNIFCMLGLTRGNVDLNGQYTTRLIYTDE